MKKVHTNADARLASARSVAAEGVPCDKHGTPLAPGDLVKDFLGRPWTILETSPTIVIHGFSVRARKRGTEGYISIKDIEKVEAVGS